MKIFSHTHKNTEGGNDGLHKTAEVKEVIDELEQLANVICDGGRVGVELP